MFPVDHRSLDGFESRARILRLVDGRLPVGVGVLKEDHLAHPLASEISGDGERIFFGIQNEREWERFCEAVLGRPEMARDELFDDNSRRVENREALEEEISAILGRLSSEEAIQRLERAAIANARMRSIGEFIEHPQLAARDRWREVGSEAGPLHALLPPVAMTDTKPVMAPIPSVGEHTDEILKALSYDEETIAALRRDAAI
jgi:crotonobetainyl-CoA:carnitine CoA-transferase CaiB-like acyl-CoA transferase